MKNRFFQVAFVFAFVVLSLTFIRAAASTHDGDDRRPLEHEDYDRWNTIVDSSLSNDGKWIMYSVRNGKEEPTLKIRNAMSDREYSIADGTDGRTSFDSQYAAYRIETNKELLKKLKKEKKKPEEYPKAKFEILHLVSGRHWTISDVKSFSMPRENGDWIAYHLEKPAEETTVQKESSSVSESYEVTPEGLKRAPKESSKKPKEENPSSEKKAGETKEKKTEQAAEKTESKENEPETLERKKADDEEKEKKEKPAGTMLVLRNLKTNSERRFPDVVQFTFSKDGSELALATSTEDNPDGDGVTVVDLEDGDTRQIIKGLGNYQHLVFSDDASQLAFVTDRDDYKSKDSSWSLYLWKTHQKEANRIAAEKTAGIPEGWWLSSTAAPAFSENSRRLYFDTAPKPEDANKKDDEEEEPKAKLDIWHWQDPLLQPQQLLQAEEERKRGYRASFDLRKKKIAQLANKEIPVVMVDPRREADVAIAVTQEKYKKVISWDFPGYRDVYLVNLKTGENRLVLEKIRSNAQMSPDGKFIIWWDTETRHWFAMSTNTPKPDKKPEIKKISQGIDVALFDELHDTPSEPPAYGVAGWLADDQAVFVYDRYDIWQLDPSGEKPPVNLTENKGRDQKIRFRLRQLDNEQRSFDTSTPWTVAAFNEVTKTSGYFRFDYPADKKAKRTEKDSAEPPNETTRLTQLLMLDENVADVQKAKNTDAVIFTRSTFENCPDLWYSTTAMKKIQRISRINPQQHEYNWGTVELIKWAATDGQELDGLLYKPDDFDATKKYPLLVYFYERNSDNLHRYYAPAAGRSIINFSFYVSRGYVLFVPDIPYKTGEPGPSAANAVLPGVEHLLKQGFIDEKRIGMQGHSWGGYQTAYLVTQTDMFACAESGAPVSNMTSAYGGIRWGSGMSRMFQYERTQSRIGEPLWQARDKYIDNSPLFFADKINTPLLILHNDNDGAVPWYQGIELFVALRRLEKPAWLLNYNDNPHWVMGEENRRDFAQRMQQFFDHYLQGDPVPEWMAKGLPAVDKGKKFGFEPVEEKKSATESKTGSPEQTETVQEKKTK